jgi:nickel transport protein
VTVSEDGHGADFSFTVDAQGALEKSAPSLLERYSRIVVGVSIIFGIFGLVSLFWRRRRAN